MPSTDVSQMCPKLCNCMWNAPIKSIPCHTLSRGISALVLRVHCTRVFLISILEIQLLFDWPLILLVFDALQLMMRQGVVQTELCFLQLSFHHHHPIDMYPRAAALFIFIHVHMTPHLCGFHISLVWLS